MIEILASPDHVGAYRLTGTLTEDDLEQVITDIEARLKRHDKVGVLADMTAFHDIGLRAGLKDLRYSLGKIGEWKRFPREAIITDRQWIRTIVGFTAPIVPFVSLKCFTPEEADAALAWAGDFDPGLRVEAA